MYDCKLTTFITDTDHTSQVRYVVYIASSDSVVNSAVLYGK